MAASAAVAAGPTHLDVLIVGAGLSGIGAAHYLQRQCPWADYAIFEARDAIGGTWDLFRYPGVRSDSDMHTLGYSFRPWDGEKSIADGDSILQYIKDTARESGIDERIRFNHRITAAEWSTPEARWHVTAERTDTDQTIELTASFLFSCSGYYRYDHGYLPDFTGMDDFAGAIVHPQDWPEGLDVNGKSIVVIGSGATAVTLVPALARSAAHVTMLQRSPTYVASLPEKSPAVALLRKILPAKQAGTAAKWLHAFLSQAFYRVSRKYPKLVRRMLAKGLARQLPAGYDIATHFTPRYDPWDQRFCAVPNGDLFKTISSGAASVVTDQIDRFTESGLLLASGQELQADIIVTATGLELLFLGGIALTVDGVPVDPATRLTYKGMMLEGVPNMALAIGYTNASWTLKCDLTCDYVCRLLNYMHDARADRMRAAQPGRFGRVGPPARTDLRVHPALGASAAETGHDVPLEGAPELSARLPRPQDERRRRRDHGVLRRDKTGEDPRAGRLLTGTSDAMKEFRGRVAAITGAGSGIGRALAAALVRRGAHLALSDIDDTGLAETVAACEGFGVSVTSRHVDVADRAAVYSWADQVVADHGRVNLVINNAGVALGATIESMSYDDFEWLMDINFWGVVYGSKAFLPHLKQSGEGHIVNLSSVFGLISVPSQSAYNAAKFAVRGFSDTLRMELEIEHANVSVTTVHPGGIKTNIARNARMDASVRDLTGDPEKAVERLRACLHHQSREGRGADPHRHPP